MASIMDKLRSRMQKFLRVDHLNENPQNDRLVFIGKDEETQMRKVSEYSAWFSGDVEELQNFYLAQKESGDTRDAIYNRNKGELFWEKSQNEYGYKKVHTGIPKSIITVFCGQVGSPKIKIKDNPNLQALVDDLVESTDLLYLANQEQMPQTLVQGWGAFKILFNKNISPKPSLVYYRAENVRFHYWNKTLIGVSFFDYYRVKNKNYVFIETRRVEKGDSYIEYELYEQKASGELVEVEDFSVVPELSDFSEQKQMVFPKITFPLGAVPSKFFFNPLLRDYGMSMFAGKISLFDDLDMAYSQQSATIRVSTPVEYYPIDMLERDKMGNPVMPKLFNRQFLASPSIPNGDGLSGDKIQTTQPQLNIEQYNAVCKTLLATILSGIMSPTSMGLNLNLDSNADAQREQEKITILTRNNVIDRQVKIFKDVIKQLLYIYDFMLNGSITIQDYNISVDFDDFANPSFEQKLESLGSAWNNGQISTEKFIDLLWGDSITEEDKVREREWLDSNKSLSFADNFIDNNDDTEVHSDLIHKNGGEIE